MTASWNSEFRLEDGLIYLNHAAVSPWPLCTTDAVRSFAKDNLLHGSQGYLKWLSVETQLREQLRWLINAPSADDIALLKSTSEGLSVVAHGLEWKSGDNVVIPAHEFPSNRIVWESLAPMGVEVRQVDIAAAETPEAAIAARIDGRTRLLSVSSVHYATGLRLNLEELGNVCRSSGVLFCVDAIQSLGAVPFDVQSAAADFVVADGHKWMMGPEGVALFYTRPEAREHLTLRQFGWHMVEHCGDFDRDEWQPATSARRFECGSPNMLGIHALHASLSVLQEVGIETVSRKVREHSIYLLEKIHKHSDTLQPVTQGPEARLAGIVTFRHRTADPAVLYAYLQERGVMCAQRGGGIRFSPHFYIQRRQLDTAVDLVLRFRA
ncbi:MAG: aminotransferase class V-fold PLP-dependent enzyme [Gammaproteobacteria bacterium]